jgi:hypothetical protein
VVSACYVPLYQVRPTRSAVISGLPPASAGRGLRFDLSVEQGSKDLSFHRNKRRTPP